MSNPLQKWFDNLVFQSILRNQLPLNARLNLATQLQVNALNGLVDMHYRNFKGQLGGLQSKVDKLLVETTGTTKITPANNKEDKDEPDDLKEEPSEFFVVMADGTYQHVAQGNRSPTIIEVTQAQATLLLSKQTNPEQIKPLQFIPVVSIIHTL